METILKVKRNQVKLRTEDLQLENHLSVTNQGVKTKTLGKSSNLMHGLLDPSMKLFKPFMTEAVII